MRKKTTATKKEPEYRIMPGIFGVGGRHDTGKTTFALGCGAPMKEIAFINGDVKGSAAMKDIGGFKNFAFYLDMIKLRQDYPMELDFYREMMAAMDDLPNKDLKAIVFDPWHNFVEVLFYYIKDNLSDFRRNWEGDAAIKGGKMWQESRSHEMRLLRNFNTMAECVILTAHMGPVYIGKRRTEKEQPRFSPAVKRVADMRLWLRKNPASAVPIALADKRLSKRALNEHGVIETVDMMPYKLTPAGDERSVWDVVWRYWNDPVNFRELTPYEVLTDDEIKDLSGWLTDEQRKTFDLMLASDDEDEMEESGEVRDKAIILSMSEKGSKPKEIAMALGLPMPVVLSHLS